MPLIKTVSGVRGIVDSAGGAEVTLTPQIAADMGRAFATYLRRTLQTPAGAALRLVGARDGRPGGQALLDSFASGAWQAGAEVVPLGIVTTPGTALAATEWRDELGICGGVVITASHNPQQWNGIKFLLEDGRAPTAVEASAIFGLLDRADFDQVNESPPPPPRDVPDVHALHVGRTIDLVDRDAIRSRHFRVILDSINGAGATAGRLLLARLGCTVEVINADPELGFARTPEPTAENLRDFCRVVTSGDFDIGFAQDPDADRLAIVDEAGRYIGEEYTLALAAKHVFASRPGPAVANLSTSRMIDDLAAAAGGPCVVHRSAVGEANVVQAMQDVGAHIGGEGNGGVIDPRVVKVRDSLVGMALTLQLLAEDGRPVSQLVADIPRYSIIKDKLDVDHDRITRILEAVANEFSDARINDLDGVRIDWRGGWVHVRGSNTEPIVRIIAEAPDAGAAREIISDVRHVVERVE